MTIEKISVSFKADSSGFIGRFCSECNSTFKLNVGAAEAGINFCPFCKEEEQDWLTEAQLTYAAELAADKALKPLRDQMKKMSRGRGLFRISMSESPKPSPPIETDEGWPSTTTACCSVEIKHMDTLVVKYCPICGDDF